MNLKTNVTSVNPQTDADSDALIAKTQLATNQTSHKTFIGLIAIVLLLLSTVIAAILYQRHENQRLCAALDHQQVLLKQIYQAEQQATSEAQSYQAIIASRLTETEKKIHDLGHAYQRIYRSETQHVLADIEQILLLANEAMHITHDVSTASKLILYADRRLQGNTQPELIKLHRAIQHDIKKLSDLPQTDTAALMTHIDRLLKMIDDLPANFSARSLLQPVKPAVENPSQSKWHQAFEHIWNQLKSLVEIRRLDKTEASLLTVDQLVLVRENIKLRLISTRIALMSQNQVVYRTELGAIQHYLKNYFDLAQPQTQQFNTIVSQLFDIKWTSDKPLLSSLALLPTLSAATTWPQGGDA